MFWGLKVEFRWTIECRCSFSFPLPPVTSVPQGTADICTPSHHLFCRKPILTGPRKLNPQNKETTDWIAHVTTIDTFIYKPIFRRVRKTAKSDYLLGHVCPSIRMEELGSHCTDFHKIWYLSIIQKIFLKIRVSLKSDKNSGHFTCRPIHISYISLSS